MHLIKARSVPNSFTQSVSGMLMLLCVSVVFNNVGASYCLDANGTYFLRGIFQLLLSENYSTAALKGAKSKKDK